MKKEIAKGAAWMGSSLINKVFAFEAGGYGQDRQLLVLKEHLIAFLTDMVVYDRR
jgi:hypothetical protein